MVLNEGVSAASEGKKGEELIQKLVNNLILGFNRGKITFSAQSCQMDPTLKVHWNAFGRKRPDREPEKFQETEVTTHRQSTLGKLMKAGDLTGSVAVDKIRHGKIKSAFDKQGSSSERRMWGRAPGCGTSAGLFVLLMKAEPKQTHQALISFFLYVMSMTIDQ